MPPTRLSLSLFNTVNPGAPAHAIADDELATATNVDFGVGGGALMPRRGAAVHGTVVAGTSVNLLFRNNNDSGNIGTGQFYTVANSGIVYRGSSTSWTPITTGPAGQDIGFTSVNTFGLISAGTNFVKDDGTTTTDWIKQVPGTPTITVNTLAPISYSTGSFSVTEGTALSGSSTCTAATQSSNRITFYMVLNGTSGSDLTVNGTNTIGDFGVHFIDLAFSNPSNVLRIAQDWSIGDTTFHNYWHSELFPQNALVPFIDGQPVLASALNSPDQLIDNQLNVGTDTTQPLSQVDRETMISAIRTNNGAPGSLITRIQDTFAPWAVSRSNFTFVGTNTSTAGSDLWKSILAVRYTVEFNATTTATIRNAAIGGAEPFPLTDLDVGYTWWQTWATLDTNGNKISEGAPSSPSTTKTMQNANVTVVSTATATGSHGITHTITYRQGGFTRDAYAISTVSYSTATITDTLNDIQALSLNFAMPRNIMTRGDFPGAITTIEHFQDRVFVAGGSPNIRYSLPGVMDTFPKDSIIQVSHEGDPPHALVSWPPGLVIVDQYTVYELTGNNFEEGDWTLTKSGSKHGSIPHRVPIRTPWGIPMLNYDGLFMYLPGEGVDQEIGWLVERYGDMFRGANGNDPAAVKGSRIPAISYGHILGAATAYGEGKLYLSAATGTDTSAQTLYVIDFTQKRCWWYRYRFGISALLWDVQDRRLMAATTDGRIMQLEIAQYDIDTNGTASGVAWTATTKKWSVNNDTLLEHAWTECQALNSVVVSANFDGTTTALSTLTNTARAWTYTPLNGRFSNGLDFTFSGTTSDNFPQVFQFNFDLLAEPPQVFYWRTEYEEKQSDNDKLWDVAYADVASRLAGNTKIVAVTFVDNVAVMTNTHTALTGRKVFMNAFPAKTYGRVAWTTYTSTALFQHWDTEYLARPEPPLITFYRSEVESLEENICDAWDVDINPGGTATATCFVDNTAVSTQTITGTDQQSFTLTLPNEQYGRTIYVNYSGGPFKMYKTWFHLRPEPDRWTNFVTPKISGEEHEWKTFIPELNCLGNTVLATSVVEGTAVATHTITGSTRQQYTFSMPVRTFGRTIWTIYNAVSGTFKRYPASTEQLEYEGNPEPSRVTTYRIGPHPYDSSHYLKTWNPRLDPLTGTVTGTLIVDDVVMTTATFTGDRQQWFTVGLDLDGTNVLNTGSRWEAIYSRSDGKFKHYQTELESEAKPFGKKMWSYSYRKVGGASQLDFARFWSIDAESTGTATFTYFWDIDGTQFTTGTITLTGGPQWIDRIAFPPGGRGRLFDFRFQGGSNNVKVSAVNLDLMQEGIKALVRRSNTGHPDLQISEDAQT